VSFFGWFVGLVVPVRDFCSALAALAVPVQNTVNYSSPETVSIFFPIAQQAGQSAMLGQSNEYRSDLIS
jgi:hypothetical protein